MDVSIHYYNNGWQDLTSYATGFHVEDLGINRVPTATVNLEGTRTALDSFIANPYKVMRIRINPQAWQTIFLGHVDNPFVKSKSGVLTARVKLSLDCLSREALLASDYITFDYYKLQSAITPYAGAEAWTYRKLIEDMFTNLNDSSQDGTGLGGTGFTVEAATNPQGIDHLIDKSCTWDKQSLFEAIRTVCDRIGYDGYYIGSLLFAEAKLYLYPFNKNSVATLSDPFLREPQWEGGSLQDLANVIFLSGGVDAGIPSDGDRWTEYAVAKYNPAIWSVAVANGQASITDVDNSVFPDVNGQRNPLRANSKCVKTSVTNSTSTYLDTLLYINYTEWGNIDALYRITQLTFSYLGFITPALSGTSILQIWLYDDENNRIFSDVEYGEGEKLISVILNTEPIYYILGGGEEQPRGKWVYDTGVSTFDWEHVRGMKIKRKWKIGSNKPDTSHTWGFYIDGLQFVGGMKIEPFLEYSELLNPPAHDHTSINTYGVHVLHYQDTLLSSFEQAQAEGARLLANLKTPNPTLTVTKIAPATQLRPSNVVTVAGTDNRIVGVTYDWNAKDKQCYATYKMVSKLMPLPPIWSEINELRFLVR